MVTILRQQLTEWTLITLSRLKAVTSIRHLLSILCWLIMSIFRLRECQRTQGVSTTDLVGRMLLLTRGHQLRGASEYKVERLRTNSESMGQDSSARSPWTGVSQFLPTTQRIIQFSEGKEPKVIRAQFELFC